MRSLTRMSVTLAAAAIAAAAVAAPATPAMAAAGTVTCTGTQQQTFNPGLTLATQTVAFQATAALPTCVSSFGDGVTSGSFTIEGGGPASCTLASFYSELTLHWNTGETSRIGLNTPADLKPLGQTVAVSYGQVLSGKYVGATVAEVLELTPDALALTKCLSPDGLRGSGGAVNLTIVDLT